MGKTEKEVLTGLLSTAYQLDEAGVASLYNEDGSLKDDSLDHLKKLDGDRIAKVKGDVTSLTREHYSRGKKETMEGWEKSVKDKFGMQSEKTGIELLEEVVQSQQPKGEPLTDDAVKKHPLYLTLERLAMTKENEFKTTLDTKLKEAQAGHERELTLAVVVDEAKAFLQTLKPILPKDPIKASNQLKWYELDVRSLNYQVHVDGGGKRTLLLLDKEGVRLDDPYGHPVKINEKLKEIADKYYEFELSEERSSAGPTDKGTTTTAKNGALVIKKPANKDEYNATMARILDEVKDPKERAEATKKLRELHEAG